MSQLLQDLRFALRGFVRRPGFAALAVLALALGIGGTTATFSVVEAQLLRSLPLPEPDRLVKVWETHPGSDRGLVSTENFLDWRREAESFESLAGYIALRRNLSDLDDPVQVRTASVSPDFFRVLGVAPVAGRTFGTAEDGAREAVLASDTWYRLFGGDEGVVGRELVLDGEAYTVVGVVPGESGLPHGAELWTRAALPYPELPGARPEAVYRRDTYYFQVVGRLAPSTTAAEADQEMVRLGRALEERYPGTNARRGARVVALHDEVVGSVRPALLVLLGGAGLLLLIACVDVANLVLGRLASRGSELAVRMALGAGPGRVLRQILVEVGMIAVVGGALGALLAHQAVAVMDRWAPIDLPRLEVASLNPAVLAFTCAVSALAALVSGVVPGLWAIRKDAAGGLHGAGRGASADRSRARLRGTLVVGEAALALMLLIGAGLVAKSVWNLQHAQPGFDPERLLVARVTPAVPQAGATAVRATVLRVAERLRALPGVSAVEVASALPLSGDGTSAALRVAGRELAPGEEPDVTWRLASARLLPALGVPLVSGRMLDAGDVQGSEPVAVVNETLARQLWPGESPLGQRIGTGLDGPGAEVTVVGVVGDTPQAGFTAAVRPEMVRPLLQDPRFPVKTFSLAIRTAGDPEDAIQSVRATIRHEAPDLVVFGTEPMAARLRESYAREAAVGRLLVLFAACASLLAAVGLFGVMAAAVGERRREFGIRMALGARPGRVVAQVLRGALLLTALGVGVGLVAASILTGLLQGFLFEVAPTDPLTFVVVALLFLGVGVAAAWVPAQRASRVDPVETLRSE